LEDDMDADLSRPVEQLRNVKQAAAEIGIPYFKLARAVKAGLVPSYTICNSRRLVRVSEILEVIEASRQGGDR
jgi:hypothetical protein